MNSDMVEIGSKKTGRPRIEITAEQLRQIETLAGYGLTLQEIARVVGISLETLKRRKKDTEAVDEAIARGRASAAASVARKLFQLATEGCLSAIIWYERTRCGRSEKNIVEHVGSVQSEQAKVVVMLPDNNRDLVVDAEENAEN